MRMHSAKSLLLVIICLCTFKLSADENKSNREGAPDEDHGKAASGKHPTSGAKSKEAILKALNGDKGKLQALKELSIELGKTDSNPHEKLTAILDSHTINLTELNAAAGNYFSERSTENESLKLFLAVEAMSLGEVKNCLLLAKEAVEKEGAGPTAIEEAYVKCGLPINEKNRDYMITAVLGGYSRKISEWAYVLGLPTGRAEKTILSLEKALNADPKDEKEAGKILAELLGSKPVASRNYIMNRLVNVPVSEADRAVRSAILNSIEWAKKQIPGESLQNAFNEHFFNNVKQNKDNFWSLVDKAKSADGASAKSELVSKYSQNLPTFIRTLHEQAIDSTLTPQERAKAQGMLKDVLAAVSNDKEGKKMLSLVNKEDLKKFDVDVTDGGLNSLGDLAKYNGRPEKGRYIPKSADHPKLLASAITAGDVSGITDSKPSDDTSGASKKEEVAASNSSVVANIGQFVGADLAADFEKIKESPNAEGMKPAIDALVQKHSTLPHLDALMHLSQAGLDEEKARAFAEAVLKKSAPLRVARIKEIESKLPREIASLLEKIASGKAGNDPERVKDMAAIANAVVQTSDAAGKEAVHDYLYHQYHLDQSKWAPLFEAIQNEVVAKANGEIAELVKKGKTPQEANASIIFNLKLSEILSLPQDSYLFQMAAKNMREAIRGQPELGPAFREIVQTLHFGEKGKALFDEPIGETGKP